MDKSTAKTLFVIGIAIILLALLIGPTTTTTSTECTDTIGRYPGDCYDVTYEKSNPSFYFFIGLGSLLTGPSFWWLVIRDAVESGNQSKR